MDGKELGNAFLPADTKGEHQIVIVMQNNDFGGVMNKVANRFSLPNPQTDIDVDREVLMWKEIEGAVKYRVYRNGEVIAEQAETEIKIDFSEVGSYKVTAIDAENDESFSSEPDMLYLEDREILGELEVFTPKADYPFVNYNGEGFVEISNTENREINIAFDIEEAGDYLIDFRYSNGSGPWNTDNKCAIRTLYVNEEKVGAVVFPQRGTDEWSDWGWSNSYVVSLDKGINPISLIFKDWNVNMNVEVNRAMLDQVRLVRL